MVPVDIPPDMGLGIAYELLAIVAFVLSSVICYAVVLRKNTKRDVYHQIPILKVFLYALVWTPLIVFWGLLMIAMLDAR
jgi:hypothetical protein